MATACASAVYKMAWGGTDPEGEVVDDRVYSVEASQRKRDTVRRERERNPLHLHRSGYLFDSVKPCYISIPRPPTPRPVLLPPRTAKILLARVVFIRVAHRQTWIGSLLGSPERCLTSPTNWFLFLSLCTCSLRL